MVETPETQLILLVDLWEIVLDRVIALHQNHQERSGWQRHVLGVRQRAQVLT